MFGFQNSGSILCWIQGIITLYCPLASWMWTTVLAFTIYGIIVKGKLLISHNQALVLCWGFPLVLTLLPLVKNDYGSSETHTQWCVLVPRGGSNDGIRFWSYGCFFL
eukprot:gene15590-21059_t